MRTYTEIHEKHQELDSSSWNQDDWNIPGEAKKEGAMRALRHMLTDDVESARVRRFLEDGEYSDEMNYIHDWGYVDGVAWAQEKSTVSEQTAEELRG